MGDTITINLGKGGAGGADKNASGDAGNISTIKHSAFKVKGREANLLLLYGGKGGYGYEDNIDSDKKGTGGTGGQVAIINSDHPIDNQHLI